jgi:hypothetical protein
MTAQQIPHRFFISLIFIFVNNHFKFIINLFLKNKNKNFNHNNYGCLKIPLNFNQMPRVPISVKIE